MRPATLLIRAAVTLTLVEVCLMKLLPPVRKAGKYPLEIHQMFRDRLAKVKEHKKEGVWSAWSPWSQCSRSCGGGVTQQTRHCISGRFRSGRGRRRRQEKKAGNHCVGLYKRFHLCNTKECPSGHDFRAEQCAAFNRSPFRGRYYFWEPYLQAGDECALNCRASGMEFYATLNKTVHDGTSCLHPVSATGKAAPHGSKGLCVAGYCKSVASNGVIGAVDDAQEDCLACMQGTCRSISGLYTRPDLPQGYSLVAQVPQGACKIIVQQLKHTRNYIALRNVNSSYILNGDWKFSPGGVVEGAGTRFTYRRQDATSLETITAPGPITNPIDIMIVNQQPNPGIKYGYALSMEENQEQIAPPFLKKPIDFDHRRLDANSLNQRDEPKTIPKRTRMRRRFIWKISSVSACSKSCGGGIQTTILTCVREHLQTVVSDRRCSHLEKPTPQQIRCNIQACPAYWGGTWDTCSGSCGQGIQHFILRCQQEIASGRTVIVNDGACLRAKPIAATRPCALLPCENVSDNELPVSPDANPKSFHKEWKYDQWSPCSVSCGTGQRTRSVTCPSGQCHPEERPPHAEYCENGPCSSSPYGASPWLITEWSHCSEACGTGIQSRFAVCSIGKCEERDKPETSRACSSERQCGGQWYTGPWGACSDSCGDTARQKRDVLCIVKIRGLARITNDMTCSLNNKPVSEQLCEGGCSPKWYTGEWNSCEDVCPNSVQRREVKCLYPDGNVSNGCSEENRPASKRPCSCPKRDEHNKPVQDEPIDRICVDRFSNCHLAVQARLCQYPYYQSNCCVSCKKSQYDTRE